MPVINQKNAYEHRLTKYLVRTVKPFIYSDYQLIIFFDSYFDTLIAQNIILGYVYFITKQTIDIDFVIDMSDKHLVIEIERKDASFKIEVN